MNLLNKILASFGYESWVKLGESLAPTFKYQLTIPTVMVGSVCAVISRVLGIDALAFAGFLVALIAELVSGIQASKVREEPFESAKLSRFTFKVVYYLVIMAVPHLFAISYEMRDNALVAGIFHFVHVFLTLQIVLEILVSILENMGTISGKPKTHWIKVIKDKIGGFGS